MTKQREHKGISLLEFKSDYIVIDVETTDFDYFYGDIIEIGMIKYRNFEEVDRFITLVNSGEKIPPHITCLTGITNDDIKEAPSMLQVAPDVSKFIGDSVIVGHNVNFDINFLYDSLFEFGIILSNDFIDTLRLARILLKNVDNHKLRTLTNHLGLSEPGHRAMVDVVATNELYCELNKINNTDTDTLLNFINRRRNRKNVPSVDFTLIKATTDEFDKEHPFFGKHFCFTGKMDMLTKSEASQIIANLGGVNQNNVTTKTDVLVLGNLEYQQEKFGKKSSKHLKAEKMIENDHHIEILTEVSFLEIINQ